MVSLCELKSWPMNVLIVVHSGSSTYGGGASGVPQTGLPNSCSVSQMDRFCRYESLEGSNALRMIVFGR